MMTNYKKYVKLQEVLDPVAAQPTHSVHCTALRCALRIAHCTALHPSLTLPPVQLDCRDRRLLHPLQPAAGPPGEMDRSGPL
jgi:hypothetical protein